MKEILMVFIGGGTGSVLRFITSMFWRHLSLHPRFEGVLMPWPTLLVNILGCFLISIFYLHGDKWGLSLETRLLLTTGFCGGLTTFSTFSYETVSLLNEGHTLTAVVYVALSLAIGMAAAFVPMIHMSEM